MILRPATTADIPAVLPMVARTADLHESLDPAKYCFLPHPWKGYEPWLTERAADPESVFLVADAGAKLVGFIVASIEEEIPIYRIDRYAFIHDLWVEEECRHAGVAKQLVMQTVERFAQLGVKQVRLEAAHGNEPARRLFASCGFRPSALEMLIELKGG